MLITIDTSAIIAVIGNETHKARLVSLTQGDQLVAPLSVHYEIDLAPDAMHEAIKKQGEWVLS